MGNQQALGEPATEIVGTDVVKVVVADHLGGAVGAFFDDRTDVLLGEVDERFGRIDLFTTLSIY